jgi:hypothetical protein
VDEHAPWVDHGTSAITLNEFHPMAHISNRHNGPFRTFNDATWIVMLSGFNSAPLKVENVFFHINIREKLRVHVLPLVPGYSVSESA